MTAGFYSKDQIFWYATSSQSGSFVLWMAGIIGAFLTHFITFQMITFYGEAKTQPSFLPGKLMTIPLIILSVLLTNRRFYRYLPPLAIFTSFQIWVDKHYQLF